MNITQLKNEGLKREFRVTIPAKEFEAKMREHLESLGSKVRISGFRHGKVPLPVLKQRYGQSALQEVASDLMRKGIDEVVRSNNLKPVLQPAVTLETLKENQDFSFVVGVEEAPVVEPADFSDVSLEKYIVSVDDKTIDEELTKIAESNFVAEALSKPRPAKLGDVVVISFSGKLATGKEIEGGSDKEFPLHLGSHSFIPGFEDQLVGVSAGESVEVKVSFPKNYHVKALAGKAAIFAVDVHEIKERKKARVNEDLAKNLGFESLDALRERVREDMSQNYAGMSRTFMKRQLLDALAERHSFDVPQGMVDVEFNAIWQQLQNALQNTADREEVLGEDVNASEDELKTEYRGIAERRVRLGLLLAAIGQKHQISVSPDELRQAVINEARRYPGQEQKVVEYYSKNNEALMQLRAPLFEEKVVDHIFQSIKVLETQIDANEMMKKIESL